MSTNNTPEKKSKGWILLHRDIFESPLWRCEPFSKQAAWVDLLLLAGFEDKTFLHGNDWVSTKPGEFITSIKQLSERWKWDRKKVRNFLQLLKIGSMVDHRRDGKRTIIFIVNYELYQKDIPAQRGYGPKNSPDAPRCLPEASPNAPHLLPTTKELQRTNKELLKKGGEALQPPTPLIKIYDHVFLTETQKTTIETAITPNIAEYYFKHLDGYLENNPQKRIDSPNKTRYRNHFKVIRNWVTRDKAEGKGPFSQKSFQNGHGPPPRPQPKEWVPPWEKQPQGASKS